MKPRVAAVHILDAVLEQGRSLDDALGEILPRVDAQERGVTQALVYGVLRWKPRLEAYVGALTDHDNWRKDARLRYLLLLGAWEAHGLATPDHAAVSETVHAARQLRRPRATGLVNALLRRLRDDRDQEAEAPWSDDATELAHPEWLLERLQAAWPEDWRAIAEANNEQAPMTLRVNRVRTNRDAYRQMLLDAAILAEPGDASPDALILDRAHGVDELPGFRSGEVSVQDESAQLASLLLAPQDEERILDACAAPGGKTGHILEIAPEAHVTVLDIAPQRLERVRENLTRLGVAGQTQLLMGDAQDPDAWWDGRAFDRILVDAPCTGTGVIRRHPDIKWLRRPDDARQLAATQRALLEAAWGMLAPGGRLVYATCSTLPEENEHVVAAFLANHPDAQTGAPPEVARPRAVDGVTVGGQILPGEGQRDGFFYAVLDRPPEEIPE